jgi:hypothetical protein
MLAEELAPSLLNSTSPFSALLRSSEAILSSTACASPGNLHNIVLAIWPPLRALSIRRSVRKNLSHEWLARASTSRLAECACSSGPE